MGTDPLRSTTSEGVARDDDLERLGDAGEFQSMMVKRVGSGPCANGCGRDAPRYVMFGREVPAGLCEECQAVADAERDARDARELVDDKLARAGLQTERFAAYTVESFPSDGPGADALKRALAWSRIEERPNLFVFGEVGRGKTGLVVAVLRQMIEEEMIEARLVNWLDYLDQLRESYGGGRPPAVLERVHLLAIDDLGAERPTQWALDQVATLVERRYREGKTTIVTSNYRPNDLAERLGREDPVIGSRIVSRLIEGAIRIEVGGSDRRRPRARIAA